MNKEENEQKEFNIDKMVPLKDPIEDGRVRIGVELRIGNSGEFDKRLERVELLRKELAMELHDLSEFVEAHPFGISLVEE